MIDPATPSAAEYLETVCQKLEPGAGEMIAMLHLVNGIHVAPAQEGDKQMAMAVAVCQLMTLWFNHLQCLMPALEGEAMALATTNQTLRSLNIAIRAEA